MTKTTDKMLSFYETELQGIVQKAKACSFKSYVSLVHMHLASYVAIAISGLVTGGQMHITVHMNMQAINLVHGQKLSGTYWLLIVYKLSFTYLYVLLYIAS